MLRKILEKIFINKKFTQWKTSRTLKIDVFEIPDNRNIEKCFSNYELLFLNQAKFCSDPSQILMLQFPTPGASLSLTSLPNFTRANWNPSSTQYLSRSSSFCLFFPNLFDHTLPHVLDISNHMPSQPHQMHYQAIYRSLYLMGQTRYPLKSWVFKGCSSFKVRQHCQQQLYLQ